AAAGAAAGFGAGAAAGFGAGGLGAAAAGLGAAGFGAGAAGFAAGAAALGTGAAAGISPMSFHAFAHSPPSMVFLPPLIIPVACFAQSGCSQFAHFVTAFWPQGFFLSNPTSMVQVSMTPP